MLEIKGISQQIEDIRIIINGKEFKLTAVQSQNQEILLNTTQTLVTFVSQLIEELRNNGRIRTAETYRCALNSFLRFLEKDDILFCKINKAFETNWRQTEEDLMSHPELKGVMTIAEFRENYQAYYPADVNDLYQYRLKNEEAWLADNTVTPVFELLPISPLPTAEKDLLLAQNVGKIAYRNATGTDLSTSTLQWTISPIEIQALAKNSIKNVVRAIKLVSQNAAVYPDIYVIFKSGDIELEKKTVTANMHLTEKQIAEYWYNSGAFTQGTTEIHTNVVTPEEAKCIPDTTVHTGTDVTKVWKPIEFKNTFANVFLKNFAGNTPETWITFDGVDATDPNQPFKKENLSLFQSVVKYTLNGTTYYCNLAIENYKFDVRFLRPVSLDKTKDTEIEDATSKTDKAQVIKLHDLINGYKDYRDAWKVGANRGGKDKLDYEMYYAEDNKVDFTVGVQSGLTVGDYLSQDPNVLTNLDASKRTADKEWVPLRDVSAIIDFKLTADDEITYLNNQATVQDFKVKMPVAITYYWGTIYDTVTISVKKTQSNAAQR